MSSKWLVGVGLAAAGCGADAPGDLPGAAPLDCAGAVETRTLRIDQLAIPLDSADADRLGIDQGDADPQVDNQAGQTFALLFQVYPELEDTQPSRIRQRLGADTVWVIEIEQCDGQARVGLARGEVDGDRWDPLESTCRHASLSIL